MATHSSTLALKVPWMEELGAGHCPWGSKELGTNERLHFLPLVCPKICSLYLISIFALQISSSVPFFLIPDIYLYTYMH